jgi:hypothetical protein
VIWEGKQLQYIHVALNGSLPKLWDCWSGERRKTGNCQAYI